MIRTELDDDINPYLTDDETHYKLHNSHYVLGQNDYRDIQKRAKERRENLKKMIEELGVQDMVKLHDRQKSVAEMELKVYYLKHKNVIDKAFQDAFKVCEVEDIIKYLSEYLNSKS